MSLQHSYDLSSSKSTITRSYFSLRLKHEKELKEIKHSQAQKKKELNNLLKNCKGVSKRRIDTAISVYKSFALKQSITVYDFVINDLERSFVRHYEDNKDGITEYVDGVFSLHKELDEFRKGKKKEINTFKRKNQDINFTALNYHYNQLTNKISVYKELGDGYTSVMFEYSFVESIIDECFNKHISEVKEIKKEAEIKKKNEQVYLDAMKGMFNLGKTKHQQQEDEIRMILSNMALEV